MKLLPSLLKLAALKLFVMHCNAEGRIPTTVTIEMIFGPDSEDVSFKFQTEVVITDTPEVLLDLPFDTFDEAIFANERHVVTVDILTDVLYRLEVRQRNGATALELYAVYDFTGTDEEHIKFRDSNPGIYEGPYVSGKVPQATQAPTAAPTHLPPPSISPTTASSSALYFSTTAAVKGAGLVLVVLLYVLNQL